MKRIGSLIIVLLILSGVAYAESVFRELSWGDPLEALSQSYEVSTDNVEPGIRIYRKRAEKQRLGELATGAIDYYFFDKQLMKT